MTDEKINGSNQEIQDGEQVDRDENKNDIETKETAKEPKSVSFNRDVHVKRFGKPREARGSSSEFQKPIRREPFTHLSEQQLIEEANKVRAQAESVSCTTDQDPEKFFSLPHRKKLKPEQEKLGRRNSDEGSENKSNIGRSTSDVSQRKKKERTSLSTLFRKAQRNKSPDVPVVVTTKPVVKVKRSKSDVSDLKSNAKLNIHPKPIRKRSGSESEEFLKSLRNKKVQLSPIIENSPREDYFKKTSPLDIYQKEVLDKAATKITKPEVVGYERKVNPIAKPPRYKSPETEPKPPIRTKRGKSLEKEKSPPASEQSKANHIKTLIVDEVDSTKTKDIDLVEVKDRIKESIRKIKNNIYGSRDMIHSSQQPPDKPPLTRGNTVDHIVRKLKEDSHSPSPVSPLMNSYNSSNVNQPFSYFKPSVSPDPNLFARTISPDRIPSPVNKMSDRGIVYAHVVRDQSDKSSFDNPKQTVHKTYSPTRERINLSDEDEGLGFEDKYKYSTKPRYDYKYNNDKYIIHNNTYKLEDPPVKPKFREFKLTSFEDYEPTYTNGLARKDFSHDYTNRVEVSQDFIDTKYRGRGDGMDNKKKQFIEDETSKLDLDFNELTHRRKLLEERLNARMLDMERNDNGGTITRYLTESDPIYEAQKKMKATEKYVNETAKYYHNSLEKNGHIERSLVEDYDKYDSDNNRIKYTTESRIYENKPAGEIEKYRYTDTFDKKYRGNTHFPPEPEYEPPSLETSLGKPVLSPDEYTEKKYKIKSKLVTNQDVYHTTSRKKQDFGKRKGHYASNPEIAQENGPKKKYDSTNDFNSLRREKSRDKYTHNVVRRHDSGDSRDYYCEEDSPRRYEPDRLIDSGIENDFRKISSSDLHRSKYRTESDDDARNNSKFLANERRHTEDNFYPSEQIYANGGYVSKFQNKSDKFELRERSADDGSHFDPKRDRYDSSPMRNGDKISAKPPKATKKLSGLERVKQLFSRDSSKKSKKEIEEVQQKPRTRVLKSPEHLADDDFRRYRDPDPSDEERRDYREPKSSREDLNRYRSSDPRDSDLERYREDFDQRQGRYVKEKHYREERQERRHYESSDRESEIRRSDAEGERRKTRSKTAEPLDSPALAERYRERRRLATPSPTPSPPRVQPSPPPPTSSSWFKSLDRLSRKKPSKVEKDCGTATEDESPTKPNWTKSKPNSPAKNLRFFGDTDPDSDSKIDPKRTRNTHSLLRKTLSNSSGNDEVDYKLSHKSNSLSNLKSDREDRKYYKRNLHNISENHSVSENESNMGRRMDMKPPIDRRARSQSHTKTLKGSRNDVRKGSRSELREERGSSSELRSSKQDLNRDLKHRRRTPGTNSGESSTEGESSQHSQKSAVFLHATTVGEIPDPGVLARNRSRDDVSSVNSSNLQIRTTQKSFSIFAPWTPRHYNDPYDVNYAQRPRKSKTREIPKTDRPGTLQKNKSYSHSTLNNRAPNSRLTSSNASLYNRKPDRNEYSSSTLNTRNRSKKSQSSEVLNRDDRERVSRSMSMPKDKNKKAGWFNLTNKNKKHEINTRVR